MSNQPLRVVQDDPFINMQRYQCAVCSKYWAVPITERQTLRTEWYCPHCGTWSSIKFRK